MIFKNTGFTWVLVVDRHRTEVHQACSRKFFETERYALLPTYTTHRGAPGYDECSPVPAKLRWLMAGRIHIPVGSNSSFEHCVELAISTQCHRQPFADGS
jgi:hypothetical protein